MREVEKDIAEQQPPIFDGKESGKGQAGAEAGGNRGLL